MSKLKAGDRVKIEFEGTVKNVFTNPLGFHVTQDGSSGTYYFNSETTTVTKIAPKLPTKPGTVIKSQGIRFFRIWHGWIADIDKVPYAADAFAATSYAKDFEIVYEPEEEES